MLSAVPRLLSLIVAAVIGGLVVAALTRGDSTEQRSSVADPGELAFFAPQQALAEVTQMPAAARIRLGGYVEPRRTVRLSAQAPGRVTYVAGQEGERVSASQVVVALDDDALQPQYRAAWADLSGQMSGIEDAQAQLYQKLYGRETSPLGGPAYDAYERATVPFYNMAQSLFGSFVPGMAGTSGSPFGTTTPMLTQQQSQHSFASSSAARAEYERQLAALAGAQSRVDTLDAQLRDRRAVAPWQGAILQRHVRVGDIVQPGQPLVDLADVDQLDVRIEVPVAQVTNLQIGDQVPVTLGNVNVWAPVSQIFPAAAPGQHTVTVKLALPSGTPAAPGMYARAWIAQPGGGSPSELAPAIPTSAITRRGSLPVAFAVDSRGNVEMRVLRLGDAQGDNTAVLSGLRVGEMVVAQPAPDLRAGSPLTGQH